MVLADSISSDASRGGGVHDAVAAEGVDEIQPSQNRGLFQQMACSEPLDAELRGVDEIGVTFQNQVSRDAAGGGGVHDAVAAEAVDEVQTFDIWRGADD